MGVVCEGLEGDWVDIIAIIVLAEVQLDEL